MESWTPCSACPKSQWQWREQYDFLVAESVDISRRICHIDDEGDCLTRWVKISPLGVIISKHSLLWQEWHVALSLFPAVLLLMITHNGNISAILQLYTLAHSLHPSVSSPQRTFSRPNHQHLYNLAVFSGYYPCLVPLATMLTFFLYVD